MITVRLPAMFDDAGRAREIGMPDAVATIGELVTALERHHPGLGPRLQDSLYNFAVNDTLILHGADAHPLSDGDVVELIPTIAGG